LVVIFGGQRRHADIERHLLDLWRFAGKSLGGDDDRIDPLPAALERVGQLAIVAGLGRRDHVKRNVRRRRETARSAAERIDDVAVFAEHKPTAIGSFADTVRQETAAHQVVDRLVPAAFVDGRKPRHLDQIDLGGGPQPPRHLDAVVRT
jgi:hypothetical protein